MVTIAVLRGRGDGNPRASKNVGELSDANEDESNKTNEEVL